MSRIKKIIMPLIAAVLPLLILLEAQNISGRHDFGFAEFAGFMLSSVMMYLFLNLSIRLDSFGSIILGVSYSLASINIIFGLNEYFSAIIIMLPVFAVCCDYWRKKKNIYATILLIGASFLISAIPVYGIIFGLPFMLTVIILIALSKRGGLRSVFSDILLLVEKMMGGVLMSSFIWLPAIGRIERNDSLSTIFEEGTVRYKLIDILYRIFDGAVLADDGRPALTMGISVILLFLLFVFCGKIPFKLRLGSLIIILLCYGFTAYTALDVITGVITEGNNIGWFRFTLIAFVIIYGAAIALKNINIVSGTSVRWASFAVICLGIISRMTHNDAVPFTYTVVITAIDAGIAGFILLTILNGQRDSIKILCLSSCLLLSCSTILAFVQSESINPVPENGSEVTKTFGTEIGLNLTESSEDGFNYVVTTSDLRELIADLSVPRALNAVSEAALCGTLFEPYDAIETFKDGAESDGFGKYYAGGDGTEIVLSIEDYDMDNEYVVFSDFTGGGVLAFFDGASGRDVAFNGAYLIKVTRYKPICGMRLTINSTGTGDYSIWHFYPSAVSMMNSRTVHVSENEFDLESRGVSGDITVITSLEYSGSTIVRYDGRIAKTFSIGGRLGFNVPADGQFHITISERSSLSIAGGIISATSLIMVVIYNVVILRKREQKP